MNHSFYQYKMKIYNAEKRKCFKVYVSFGTWRSILPYLSKQEVLGLQRTNRFFYDIAISRVQLKLCMPICNYFVQYGWRSYRHNIFKVRPNAKDVECITLRELDFMNCDGCV